MPPAMEKASRAGARSDERGNRHRRRRAPQRRPQARSIAEAHRMLIVFVTAAKGSNARKKEIRYVSWRRTQEPKYFQLILGDASTGTPSQCPGPGKTMATTITMSIFRFRA